MCEYLYMLARACAFGLSRPAHLERPPRPGRTVPEFSVEMALLMVARLVVSEIVHDSVVLKRRKK